MPHSALARLYGGEYDPFLFAAIGQDRYGQRLSVLSALARSNVDPWEEAASLARMSRKLAKARMTALIAGLPGEPMAKLPTDAIVAELIVLLPRANNLARPAPRKPPAGLPSETVRAGLGFAAMLLLIAVALMVSAHQSKIPGQAADPLESPQASSTTPAPPASHR